MKKLLGLAVIVGLCLAGPVTSSAETVNMGQVTCAEVIEMDETEITLLYIWLDGFVSAKSGNTTLNIDSVQSDLQTLIEQCNKNPKMKVLNLVSN